VVVFGFDIEYRAPSKKASVSIWRPRMVIEEEDGQKTLILETASAREADVRLISFQIRLTFEIRR
jgi:hypothetical protein